MREKKERDLEDLLNTAEIKDFFFRAQREALPRIKESAICTCILSSTPDAKQCLEMGAALLFDKPILVVVKRGFAIPDNLRRAAKSIIEVSGSMTDEDNRKVQEALAEMFPHGTGR
jgi:hypothetical protein